MGIPHPPAATFERYGRAAGYWVSREPVEPVEAFELDDLVGPPRSGRHQLRIVLDLAGLWNQWLLRRWSSAATASATSADTLSEALV